MTPFHQAVTLTQNLHHTMTIIQQIINGLHQLTTQLELNQTTTKVLPFIKKKHTLNSRQQFAQVASYSDALERGLGQIAQHMLTCQQCVHLLEAMDTDSFSDADPLLLVQHTDAVQLNVEAYYTLEHTVNALSHELRQRLSNMKQQLLPK